MNPVYNANFKMLIKRPFRRKNKKSNVPENIINNTLIFILLFCGHTFSCPEKKGSSVKDTTVIETVRLSGKLQKRLKKEENPAYKILQKVWENKENNIKINNPFYEYDEFIARRSG
jgi:hypothetical protein